MDILEHIRNSTLYSLYANDSPEGALSNRGSGIAELIFWIEIFNFIKIDFLFNNFPIADTFFCPKVSSDLNQVDFHLKILRNRLKIT